MGAAASAGAPEFPEQLDKEQAKAFVGEKAWDLQKYNDMADDRGFVSRAAIVALGDDDEQDMGDIAATVQRDGIFFSFEKFDADASGGLTYDEFGLAAKALGYHIDPGHLDELCAGIDVTKDGIIDEEEFVKWIATQVPKSPRPLPDGLDATKPGIIYEHLGNAGAQSGYGAALHILKKRPAAASDKMPGEGKGSPWMPLHYVLTQEAREDGAATEAAQAAARARRLVAEPVIMAILKAYAPAASQRCMEGVRFPKGHLPLELAIIRGWSLAVVEALAKTYPEAVQVLDAASDKLQKSIDKKEPLKNIKGMRYMRQIAEASHADDDILVLLPKPKWEDGKVVWTSGQAIADAAAEKAKKKAEKEAKKQAKLDAGQEKRATFPTSKAHISAVFPLVSADFWTSDHLSERSRSVDAFSGTRARGTLTLKRR